MIRQVRLRPIAKKEFDEAVDWFEEKQIGLGIGFTDAVHNVLDTVSRSPMIYRKLYRDVRAVLSMAFRIKYFTTYLRMKALKCFPFFRFVEIPRFGVIELMFKGISGPV